MSEKVFRSGWSGSAEVHVDLATQYLVAEISDTGGMAGRQNPLMEAAIAQGAIVKETHRGLTVLRETGKPFAAPLSRCVADCLVGEAPGYTPAFALLWKAKRVDERIVKTVESWLHSGVGKHLGRRQLAARVRERLSNLPEALAGEALLAAAETFVGAKLPDGGKVRETARVIIAKFLADKTRSSPVGIWSENEALQGLFRHDRLLAAPVPRDVATFLADALKRLDFCKAYDFLLRVAERVTGPRCRPSLLDPPGQREPGVFPGSDSAERRLVELMFGSSSVPEGFELMPELGARIRDGRLSTVPRKEDGWYAHQLHAIASLLSPDWSRVSTGQRYRKSLEELFKALFGLNRETHLKQLEPAYAGGCPVLVRPHLTVEPLPELYKRTADGYAFLRRELSVLFGEELLFADPTRNWGSHDDSLGEELEGIEALFRGAYATVMLETGEAALENAADRAILRRFQREAGSDPDLKADVRTAVPLFFDLERKTHRLQIIIGIEKKSLEFRFREPPKIWAVDRDGDVPAAGLVLAPTERPFLCPKCFEVDARVLPTRERFREICDGAKSPEAIVEALNREES